MVGEFPELQGVMGRYYALQREAAGRGGRRHRRALRAGRAQRPLPERAGLVAVALADKLDTLIGFWAIGEKPTGSRDPFALRRAALGVIRIVVENKHPPAVASAMFFKADDLHRRSSPSA